MLYLNDAERVWKRIKLAAADKAARRKTLTATQARIIVDEIIREERASEIPREAREFYAEELTRMLAS